MPPSSVTQRLQPVFDQVNEAIRQRLGSDVSFVSEVSQYILLSGGKRLRPALFVLSARLCGYEAGRELAISPAFEFLHAATLLHDDVVDGADTRRGKKAAHHVYGNPGVILVGDFLLAQSMALGAETGMLAFTETMARAVSRMAEGEVLQLLHARDPGITEADYETVIHRKTGVLIESACYLGAVIADAPEDRAEALGRFGRLIGMAFQIIDDTLDYTGTEAEFGKPVGHDLDEGKITLPLIRTLAAARPDHRRELEDLIALDRRNPQEFARVKELIQLYRGLEQSMARAVEAVAEAKQALAVFPDVQERRDLADLGDYIVTRRK
jgi:octaprenyl-diphosphate synthase